MTIVGAVGCTDRGAGGQADTTGASTGSDTSTGTRGATSTDTGGTTTTAGGDDRCTLLPDPGSCEAAIPKWWFDPDTQRCEMFSWGGCDGTVPFDDRMECEQACEPCEAYDTVEPPEVTVAVTIRNALAEPVYLDVAREVASQPDYYFTQHYDLEQGGAPVRTQVGVCELAFSCSEVDNELCGGCDPGPPTGVPGPVEIPAMSVFDADDWMGQGWEDTVRPQRCIREQCQEQGLTDTPCHRLVSISGQLTARAKAFVGDPAGPSVEASTTFLVPDQTSVELVFE